MGYSLARAGWGYRIVPTFWGKKWKLECAAPGDEFWRTVKKDKDPEVLIEARERMKDINGRMCREHIPPNSMTARPPSKR